MLALWWWLGFRSLYHSLHITRNEVAYLEHASQELNTLSQKLAPLGNEAQNLSRNSLSLSEILLERALESDLELEQSVTPESASSEHSVVIECHVRGSFENMITFLLGVHTHSLVLLKCTLTRVSDNVIKGIFLVTVPQARDESQ
jgi:hypothetical protein